MIQHPALGFLWLSCLGAGTPEILGLFCAKCHWRRALSNSKTKHHRRFSHFQQPLPVPFLQFLPQSGAEWQSTRGSWALGTSFYSSLLMCAHFWKNSFFCLFNLRINLHWTLQKWISIFTVKKKKKGESFLIHTLLDFHQSTFAAQVLFNQKKKRNPRWFLRFIIGMENAASQLPHRVAPGSSLTNQKYRKRNKTPTKTGKTPALPPTLVCDRLWNISV